MNVNESVSSDDMRVHSADTDDSEFIKFTELPLNTFSNQIMLKIGSDEPDNYEHIFPKMFRRTITRLIFSVPLIISIYIKNTWILDGLIAYCVQKI